ncbi:MAG: efflux RND transporter periplasmic adaptor subunit [Cyanobacteria bacterium P01_H01_bin.130]
MTISKPEPASTTPDDSPGDSLANGGKGGEPTGPLTPPMQPVEDLTFRPRPLWKRPMVWGSVLALGLVGAGVLWIASGRSRMRSPQVNLDALTVVVDRADITAQINATGTVRPVQTVNLSPKVAGRLIELYVEQGDRVVAGQVIAQMDDTEARSRLGQAQAAVDRARADLLKLETGSRPEDIAEGKARVARAQAEVSSAQARLDLAKSRLARNQGLAEEGVIERDRLDGFIQEARTAEADLTRTQAALTEARRGLDRLQNGSRVEDIAQGRAAVKEAMANLSLIRTQLNDTQIRAPFAGFISQKYAEPGAFVTPTTSASTGTGATSTSIAALAQGLEILAQVPEVDIGRIRQGQTVKISADAYPDRTFEAQVKRIAPEAVLERDVTYFEVRLGLTTGREVLRSGMNVDLAFLGDRLTDVVVVPTVAVVTIRGETGVLVPNDEQEPVFRPVTLGPAVEQKIQILDGLESGDRVFTNLPRGKRLESIQRERSLQSPE